MKKILTVLAILTIAIFTIACDDDPCKSGHKHNPETGICGRDGCNALTYALGATGPGGGKIYYCSEAGFTVTGYGTADKSGYFASYTAHYLEIASNDTPYVQWGGMGYYITGITSDSNLDNIIGIIGNGRKDTQTIINYFDNLESPIANTAVHVASATQNGRADFFLPSIGELKILYDNRAYVGMEENTNWFLSSSEYDNGRVHILCFDYQTDDDFINKNSTNDSGKLRIRPIRAF